MARGQDTSRDARRSAHQDLMARNAGQSQPTAGAPWHSQVGTRQNPDADRPNADPSAAADRAKEDAIGRRWHATADAGIKRKGIAAVQARARAGEGTIARDADRNRTLPLAGYRAGQSTPDEVRAASQTGNYEPAIRQSRDTQRYLGTETTSTLTEQRSAGTRPNAPTVGTVFDRKTGEARSTGRDEEAARVRGDVTYKKDQREVNENLNIGRGVYSQTGAATNFRVLQEEERSNAPRTGALQKGSPSSHRMGPKQTMQVNPDPDPAFGASSSIKAKPFSHERTSIATSEMATRGAAFMQSPSEGNANSTSSYPKRTFKGDTPDSPRQYISRPRITEGGDSVFHGKPAAVLQAVEMMSDTTQGVKGLTQVQPKERKSPKLPATGKTPPQTDERRRDQIKSYSAKAGNPVPNAPIESVDAETGTFSATDKSLPGPKMANVGISEKSRKAKIGTPAVEAPTHVGHDQGVPLSTAKGASGQTLAAERLSKHVPKERYEGKKEPVKDLTKKA